VTRKASPLARFPIADQVAIVTVDVWEHSSSGANGDEIGWERHAWRVCDGGYRLACQIAVRAWGREEECDRAEFGRRNGLVTAYL